MPELQHYLENLRACVEDELDRVLPSADTPPGVLHACMRHAVMSGGKRLRPCLCLAVADCLAGDPTPALAAAAAVELLHTYTLVHDDLPAMDDDDERRGQPSCHVKFGETNAILAGDALQALAFQVAAQSPIAPDAANAIVRVLAIAAGSSGVVGGQVADLASADRPMTEATLAFIHQHKTADLFVAACRLGALAVQASPADHDVIGRYAACLGLTFQITDDILDGRASGDLAGAQDHGSCLRLYGLEGARERATALTDQARQAIGAFGARGRHLDALATHLLARTR